MAVYPEPYDSKLKQLARALITQELQSHYNLLTLRENFHISQTQLNSYHRIQFLDMKTWYNICNVLPT